jgi:hypothetical protein
LENWSSVPVEFTEARGQFGNPEEGESPPLEAVTKLVKRELIEKTQCVL